MQIIHNLGILTLSYLAAAAVLALELVVVKRAGRRKHGRA